MSIDTSTRGGVRTIALNRPEVLNAFDDELGTELLARVREAAGDDAVRCILITGAGRAFSSGEDLGALADVYAGGDAPPLGETLVRRYNPLIRAIVDAPKPVVAAVDGVAAGAGASLALACDFRILSDRARLVLAFVKVGLVPDSGALWFLSRMVGTAIAWQLAASGDPIDARRALELGLANEVVAADAFEASRHEFAARLAEGPTKALALTKSLLRSALEVGLDAQLDLEVDAQTQAGRTADHVEGMRAFFEKRRPSFEGR